MTLWTIVHPQSVWEGFGESAVALTEIVREGVTMMVAPQADGMARIERIISPNPMDYLRPEWQPGQLIPLAPGN